MSDWPSEHPAGDDAYLQPYRRAVEHFGATFDATLWKNRAYQTVRFDVLRQMVDLEGLTLLDAGCGLGDLCAFLHERNVRLRQYIGVDGVPAIVAGATQRRLPRAEFHYRDFVSDADALTIGHPDVIYFSGSLNTVPEAAARRVVERAWSAARRGVVFNFLSDRASPESMARDTGPARRFDTLEWLEWALRATTLVRFRQDYLGGHDATIAMMRDPAGAPTPGAIE